MAAEIFMTAVEYRKFQCIDHSTYSINNSSGKKPCKSGRGHIIEDLRKSQNTGPSHTNVEDRGDPFRTKHPECLDQYAGNRKCPYNTKKRDATSPFYYKEAYRCIASCDQNIDCKRSNVDPAWFMCSLDKERYCRKDCHEHADKMSDRTSGIFNMMSFFHNNTPPIY